MGKFHNGKPELPTANFRLRRVAGFGYYVVKFITAKYHSFWGKRGILNFAPFTFLWKLYLLLLLFYRQSGSIEFGVLLTISIRFRTYSNGNTRYPNVISGDSFSL